MTIPPTAASLSVSMRRGADRSIYTNPAVFSGGIRHVIVNGVPIVRAGEFDDQALLFGQRVGVGMRMPGRPIRAAR